MKDISKILKSDIKTEDLKQENGILCCMNDLFISGDNQKYMKMYDWMSFFYDFGEKWIGKLKYGNAIDRLRTELMSRLEWKNNISVLYVSIGTGADLRYIPQEIDLKTIVLSHTQVPIKSLLLTSSFLLQAIKVTKNTAKMVIVCVAVRSLALTTLLFLLFITLLNKIKFVPTLFRLFGCRLSV